MFATLQTTFLSALFLTALGFLLTSYGFVIDSATQVGITVDSASLQFSGAIIAAIFWVSIIIHHNCIVDCSSFETPSLIVKVKYCPLVNCAIDHSMCICDAVHGL